VLWAGRLDRQKRPDLLAAISEQARSRGIPLEFVAAGAGVLESGRDAAARLRQAGVDYRGEYRETVGSIRGSFDVLLLTSQWEGLPLTLLDAALHELTIVAGSVGGVPDFVEHGRTGYLCARYDDVEGYLQVLERLASDRADLVATRASAKDLVNTRHSWESFAATVAASARYLD
jgi:glycosyltransferase involved in cell wall biosynthesis